LVESISSPSASGGLDEAIGYCADQVKQYDRDRYFTSLFAGGAGHRALVPLYAFNLEIARIRETVSEPMLGQIRLQWWRDAIGEIYAGTPRNHPVAVALCAVTRRYDPTRARFEAMIDGREADLEDHPPATLGRLMGYVRATSGELTCLALELLGARDEASMRTGYDAGIAWALTGLLRSIPFHAANGRSYLPGVSGQMMQQNPKSEPVRLVTEQIAAAAYDADTAFRRNAGNLPKNVRPAVLHNVLARPELRRIEKAGFDPFSSRPLTPAGRRSRVVWSSMTGRM